MANHTFSLPWKLIKLQTCDQIKHFYRNKNSSNFRYVTNHTISLESKLIDLQVYDQLHNFNEIKTQ